jgi:hypothetical protein
MLSLFSNLSIIAAGIVVVALLAKLIFKKPLREILWSCVDSLF